MKLQVGDKVLVTTGKDHGKRGEVIRVLPEKNAVIVKDMNMYSRHIKPYGGQAGDIKRQERPLGMGKVAIINDKGQPDRVGYKLNKDGSKTRIYRKTGAVISSKTKKEMKSTKKESKK
ncbi:MAG: 50S ribosomal protein L24 [Candidatus Pacebacteria bacterium RIFOXYB1_FULL_39_46]|nr:MAG: 50S ribosomal protein L24 [Candidatus Pacebacteria bacterium RIFOXYB1_FULL_39_46]OGJ39014.1 MAG: 50S ribosomal protein L24 [Candidatus Pacebacteria bacterium RIFOXYA1_FULL_38_18]OGJ39985.1 MAG: 50S ribosomal protein L24 [Candidatus Pacebacteria bacterium RIFOXYD1_FULL_39_27]OGJ40753.1 MAG: 50S ribosomal protein L24 [Candidatus Pacebacteria bacterium RIFOXYC1_FULL_39_21]